MRESPLLMYFDSATFEIGECADMRIALSRCEKFAGESWLCDLSAYPKTMIVGANAETLLKNWGIPLPPLGQFHSDTSGRWVARVSRNSYLFGCEDHEFESSSTVLKHDANSAHVFAHDLVELSLGGLWCNAALAELTAVDFNQFSALSWIPVLCAGIDVTVYRLDAVNEFRMLCAPADGPYLFATLATILREHAGEIIGINDYATRKAITAEKGNP